jgi:hypothetical protein
LQDEISPSKNSPIQTSSPYLFVFLGASNLARGYGALAHCLIRGLAPQPVEILHAMGPGRGYCAQGGIFNITYPPIGSSGILKSASEGKEQARQVIALITDIGNDIMYGVPVHEIIACLDTLMQQLNAIGAEVFVHPIPLEFSKDVSERQFRILKSIFYPHSGIDYHKAKEAVDAINHFLRDKAGERIHLLPSAKDFCGVDKIHYSIFRSHKVWSGVATEMLRVLPAGEPGKINWWSTLNSLLANMGRLVFCDMFSIQKKSPQTFEKKFYGYSVGVCQNSGCVYHLSGFCTHWRGVKVVQFYFPKKAAHPACLFYPPLGAMLLLHLQYPYPGGRRFADFSGFPYRGQSYRDTGYFCAGRLFSRVLCFQGGNCRMACA